MSTSNATLVDYVQSKRHGILSENFTIRKLFMLSSEKVIVLDKKINTFSRSIRSIFKSQVTSISLPRNKRNIEAIQ